MNFAVPTVHRVKLKESEKKDKYLDLTRELKNLWNMKMYTNCNWCSWYSQQRIGKRTRKLVNKRTNGYHTNYSIVEIVLNPE